MAEHRLSIRIDLAGGARIGPGKIALLEEVARHGSISAAGRAMGMSYRRAWQLTEALNSAVGEKLVETATGGSGGGGTRLTPAGLLLVQRYRAIEHDAAAAAAGHLRTIAPPALPDE